MKYPSFKLTELSRIVVITTALFGAHASFAADKGTSFSKTSIESSTDDASPSVLQQLFEDDATSEPEAISNFDELKQFLDPHKLRLRSQSALIYDDKGNAVLYSRDADSERPIASLTKLMTAMVVLDAGLPLDETIEITRDDRDRLRGSRSKLRYGTSLTRGDMMYIALAASENRAASALARTFPAGRDEFMRLMNEKAKSLGMTSTKFTDSTGLASTNTSTANDLALMVKAAYEYPLIREMSTSGRDSVTDLRKGRKIEFFNTNYLTRRKQWNIELSKTGYIRDAGHCLVMRAEIAERPLIIVLLNSWGKHSRFGDANRIRDWFGNAERKLQRLAGA